MIICILNIIVIKYITNLINLWLYGEQIIQSLRKNEYIGKEILNADLIQDFKKKEWKFLEKNVMMILK